jgi:hypothetical protein
VVLPEHLSIERERFSYQCFRFVELTALAAQEIREVVQVDRDARVIVPERLSLGSECSPKQRVGLVELST